MNLEKEEFKKRFVEKINAEIGKDFEEASSIDKYTALILTVKELISKDWISTRQYYKKSKVKQVYYFSLEFLPGKFLEQNLTYLGIKNDVEEGLNELGISLLDIEKIEPDPAIGNGGLGRLAACFMDSMASLAIPGNGCGIRYKYGLFKQKIVDGYQIEEPDDWLKCSDLWSVKKKDRGITVKFFGTVNFKYQDGKLIFNHNNYELVRAVPYDVPIVGYKNGVVNTLRLWSAESISRDFDFASFSHGDYLKAKAREASIESITQVLYPDDSNYENRMLRLKQQYFMVSAGLQSIIRTYKDNSQDMHKFNEKVALHINDTHPTLIIPELMRILMDEEQFEWDEAWSITTKTVSYTNHTILPEALEKWPVEMMKALVPRIYMIIEEINRRFCENVILWDEGKRTSQMSIISDGQVHMAHLAIVGSYSVNGVAKLHTDILKNEVMKNFCDYTPDKFNNKTNGITHRRFLLNSNPELSNLISECIGDSWICSPEKLKDFEKFRDDSSVIQKLNSIKFNNKNKLAKLISENNGITVDENSIFDVQIKRIHAYKRQHLNVLNIMYLYNELMKNPELDITPRTFIFAGKAARGYYEAKQIIKLINSVGDKVNNCKKLKNKLKVVFLENYRVSLAEKIIPAADVSEQISTASKEASGTGNMKLMMNGAITIGTLDGANIEIKDNVGEDNIFTFGLHSDEVLEYYKNGKYNPWDIYNSNQSLKMVVDELINGFFPYKEDEFRVIYNSLLHNKDLFFVLKDFDSYVWTQNSIDKAYRDRLNWGKMSLCNIANSGVFSSDRTIMEYAKDIWDVKQRK